MTCLCRIPLAIAFARIFAGQIIMCDSSWCYQLDGHMIMGCSNSHGTQYACSQLIYMQHHLTFSKFSRIIHFHTSSKHTRYLSIPPGRSAKHLYPVCLKGYSMDYWLSRHIDLDHPRYYHRVAAQKLSRANSLAKPGASFTTWTANKTTLKGPSTTLGVSFFANHNTVDDPDALPSSATEFPACDGAQDQLESQISNTELAPTTDTFPAAGATMAYVSTLQEYSANAYYGDPFYPLQVRRNTAL